MSRSKTTIDPGLGPLVLSTGRSNAADTLQQWIEANGLEAGARLPSERDLGERLQISRTTIREALSILEARGIIEVIHGKGSFVTGRTWRSDLASYWAQWYELHGEELRHVLEVREAVEAKSALLIAAGHRRAAVLAKLGALHEDMRQSADDVETFAELDKAFHRTIVSEAANPLMQELLASLESALKDDRVAVLRLGTRVDHSLRDHAAIIQAIREGSRSDIIDSFERHYLSIIEEVEAVRVAKRLP